MRYLQPPFKKSKDLIMTNGFLAILFILLSSPFPNGEEDKKFVLENLKTANEGTTSIEANMRQRKRSSFMDKEVVTKAKFYFLKPGKFALIPNSSNENRYIANAGILWIINDEAKSVTETAESDFDFTQYFTGFGSSADQLEKWFDVQVDSPQKVKSFQAYRMELTPRESGKFEGKLDRIVVWIRADIWLPHGAEFYESDGDVTEWEFSDYKINKKVKDELFVQQLPKGYTLKKLEKK